MSVLGLLDAMRADTNPTHRLVWMCLENHANGHRFWRMTEKAIAAELHLSADTVARAIGWLIAEGIVRVERFKRRPTVFHMLRCYPAKGERLTPQDADSTEDLTPQDADSTPPDDPDLTPQDAESIDRLTPQDADSTPELTPQIADSLYPPERIHQYNNPPDDLARARDPIIAPGQVETVVVRWNEMATRHDMPPIRHMGGARQRRLIELLRDHGFGVVCEAIARIERSGYLRGGKGLKADFEFFLTNFLRILEGYYDSREPVPDPSRLHGSVGAAYDAHAELAAYRARKAADRLPAIEEAA